MITTQHTEAVLGGQAWPDQGKPHARMLVAKAVLARLRGSLPEEMFLAGVTMAGKCLDPDLAEIMPALARWNADHADDPEAGETELVRLAREEMRR